MTTRNELLALATRVEQGSGVDMALARGVLLALGWHRVTPSQCGRKHGGYIAPEDWIGAGSDGAPILDGLHGTTIYRDVPDVTSSLDGVEALRERLLPGSQYTISTANNCAAHIWLDHVTEYDHAGHAETAPRAFLAAILRAYAATVE